MLAPCQAFAAGAAAQATNPPRGLSVFCEGFSLYAGVFVSDLDGDALERLARYCARPPLSLRRLALSEDGQVLYHAKRSASGAPRLLRRSPTQFMGSLAALIPPPRAHLTRFHGIFAPHSKHRSRIIPDLAPSQLPNRTHRSPRPTYRSPRRSNRAPRLRLPMPPRNPDRRSSPPNPRLAAPIVCPGPRYCAASFPPMC
jgi:hypothetical protein